MSLPALYLEGLAQRALRGTAELNAYKVGLVEAVLKDTLRTARAGETDEAVEAGVRTAIEVTRWEPARPARGGSGDVPERGAAVPPDAGAERRSPREVLDDHLALAAAGDWVTDLERNVADDIVVLTGFGAFEGRDQLRVLAELLDAQLPNARFEYTTVAVRGEVAFLEWRADADGARVRDGADSFVIRDGRIVAQTIHYTVDPAADRGAG